MKWGHGTCTCTSCIRGGGGIQDFFFAGGFNIFSWWALLSGKKYTLFCLYFVCQNICWLICRIPTTPYNRKCGMRFWQSWQEWKVIRCLPNQPTPHSPVSLVPPPPLPLLSYLSLGRSPFIPSMVEKQFASRIMTCVSGQLPSLRTIPRRTGFGPDEWFYSVVVVLVESCPGGE